MTLLATSLLLAGGGPEAVAKESCLTPDTDRDLVVSNPCDVPGGATLQFRHVNILSGGTLNFLDGGDTHFWASSIVVENGGALTAGTDAPIGSKGGRLTIHLWGAPQGPGAKGVLCKSQNSPETCGAPAEIFFSNVEADHTTVKKPDAAVKVEGLKGGADYPGPKDDYFYAYHPLFHDGGDHNAYFGYKVLAVGYGGTLQLFGKKGAIHDTDTSCKPTEASSTGRSWVRLAATTKKSPDPDASKITVEKPECGLDWADGDDIVITTTDYLPGHSEQRKISGSPVDNGKTVTITLDRPLEYIHNGTRFPLDEAHHPGIGRVGLHADLARGAETRAAVGLLSRSIRIVSGGDSPNTNLPEEASSDCKNGGGPESNTCYFGGHTVFRQGYRTVQIHGVEFYQLGQGGRLGHYPVHFHHARKTRNPDAPRLDTFVMDSSIWDSMTRWIVLHGTQDVTLARNVGYKSIGHGFYLEDGTETNNKLLANLGVFARAAVGNKQNPRNVPGILAAPNLHGFSGDDFPYRSDYNNPTVFWIMNGWNDFQHNMAAGAGTCGACYWLVPGWNSGLSSGLKWESYASMQDGVKQSGVDRAAMTPLKSFVGNSCTSAMTSFQTVGITAPCFGVGGPAPSLPQVHNPLARPSGDSQYYPSVDGGGGRFATRCPGADCSTAPPRCSKDHPGDCMVTVLDRYTTSFNWAPFNLGAIWLRPQWYLVSNSVITDVQNAGLTFVTGGGYTAGDVIPGHWALVRNSVFIGHTQEGNAFASNGGPFNPEPGGLRCALGDSGHRRADYCLSIDEGVSHQMSNFGMYQRLFSIYDGPASQDSNAYLNIRRREIDDCIPKVHLAIFDNKPSDGYCEPKTGPKDQESVWLAGTVLGLPKATNETTKTDYCYMPNAAIGWKQPNGFYYPPALHSKNLFFNKDVDIRHFVVTPLFKEGTLDIDKDRVQAEYCVWTEQLFDSFTSIDRQTVLNDDDGTLTGYKNTTVINLDDFFHAPVEAIECLSDDTSATSPYQYLTTVLYPECLTKGKRCTNWERDCTNKRCSGVPVYRQDLLPKSDKNIAKSILMMGQRTGQRSTLTVNNGTYYVDTTRDDFSNNVFEAGQTYYLFLIYATEKTQQTYRFYVGENTDFDPATIQMVQAYIEPDPVEFDPKSFTLLPAGRARWLRGDKATAKGVVEVRLRVSDYPGVAAKYKAATKNKCQPATYCTWNAATEQCVDATGSDTTCRWGGAHPECPEGGCIGIAFTLPAGFKTLKNPETVRPAAACVPKDFTDEDGNKPWAASLEIAPGVLIGKPEERVCPRDALIDLADRTKGGDRLPDDFCE
jgi:hypothetical protein